MVPALPCEYIASFLLLATRHMIPSKVTVPFDFGTGIETGSILQGKSLVLRGASKGRRVGWRATKVTVS